MDRVEELIEKLKDTDWRMRREATLALIETGSPAVPALVAVLRDKNNPVRRSAAEMLGEIGDSHVVPSLVEVLEFEAGKTLIYLNWDMLGSVAKTLGKIAVHDPAPVLRSALPPLRRLRNYNPVFQEALCKVEAATADLKYFPLTELIAKLKHIDWRVRRDAAVALGEIQDPRAVPALLVKLKSKNIPVRTSASEALGKFKDPRAVPALIEALEERNNFVRQVAAKALMKIGSPAIPALIMALQDTNAAVRLFSAMVLGEIASRDPTLTLRDALPTLRHLRIRDLWYGTEIQQAIDQIEAATAGMKDLPLPSVAPLPNATSLPRPSTVQATTPDGLPIPSASTTDHDAETRGRRWLRREKRR